MNYNCEGEDLTGIRIQLLSPEYGYVDDNNIPHVIWGIETERCDKNGFDKEYRPIKESTSYLIYDYILPKGTVICRYGNSAGRFTTIKGTNYNTLGLPYVKDTIEYHEFKVTQDLSVNCYVIKGIVAPKFKSDGGGIQFMHKQIIALECDDGYLEEDYSWIQQNI